MKRSIPTLLVVAVVLALSASSAAASDVKALYSSNCASCHAANGKGAFPAVPDLALRMGKTDAQLISSTLKGFKSEGSTMPMPPKGGNPKLTAANAAALVVYVRGLVKSRVATGKPQLLPGAKP